MNTHEHSDLAAISYIQQTLINKTLGEASALPPDNQATITYRLDLRLNEGPLTLSRRPPLNTFYTPAAVLAKIGTDTRTFLSLPTKTIEIVTKENPLNQPLSQAKITFATIIPENGKMFTTVYQLNTHKENIGVTHPGSDLAYTISQGHFIGKILWTEIFTSDAAIILDTQWKRSPSSRVAVSHI